MKIIKPSYSVVDSNATTGDEILERLEKIGRTCYKSEDKITDGSARRFIKMLVDRGHLAMIEHHRFIAKIPEDMFNSLLMGNLHFMNLTKTELNGCIVSYNARTLIDAVNSEYIKGLSRKSLEALLLITSMHYNCPELFNLVNNEPYDKSLDNLKVQFLTNAELLEVGTEYEIRSHCWQTVRFVCDRGVSHELVRHRVASFGQESTRYCNYSKEKFGNEITVILPCFFDTGLGTSSNSIVYETWKHSCECAESDYFKLLDMGAKPQEARDVLPNSLKTEIVVTMTVDGWRNFFSLRCDTPAHPQMRELSIPLLETMNNIVPGVFSDLYIKFVLTFKDEH